MANEQSWIIGKIDCVMCGEEMPVRQNGRDTFNLSCPWCGHSSYAKGGTQAHSIVEGWLKKEEKPAPIPATPEPKTEHAAPVVSAVASLAKTARGFALEGL